MSASVLLRIHSYSVLRKSCGRWSVAILNRRRSSLPLNKQPAPVPASQGMPDSPRQLRHPLLSWSAAVSAEPKHPVVRNPTNLSFHPQRAGLEAMILAPWSSDGYPFQTDRIFRVPEKSEKSLCI